MDNYIVDENIIKEQVILLEKKFDDLMIEFEILNNFNSLFKAVKERARINNNDLLSKTFAEKTIAPPARPVKRRRVRGAARFLRGRLDFWDETGYA